MGVRRVARTLPPGRLDSWGSRRGSFLDGVAFHGPNSTGCQIGFPNRSLKSTAEDSSTRFVFHPLPFFRATQSCLLSHRHVSRHPSSGCSSPPGWLRGFRGVVPRICRHLLGSPWEPSLDPLRSTSIVEGVGGIGTVQDVDTNTIDPSEPSIDPSKCGWNERRRVETAWTWRTCLPSQTVECDMLEAVVA